jgi:hypothetical protein
MKKNTTYIAANVIAAIVVKSGLPTEEKKGWTLVGNYGTGGARIYVPHTKNVGRIDLSAFTVPVADFGVVDLGGLAFGNVHQQLDFSLPAEQVLVNLEKLLAHMATLAKPAKTPRKSMTPKPVAASSTPEAPAQVDPVAERKKKILARAQELILSAGLSAGQAIVQAQADFDEEAATAPDATEPAAS